MLESKLNSAPQISRGFLIFWITTISLMFLCLTTELVCYLNGSRNAVYIWPCIPFYGFLDFYCFAPRFHFLHSANFFLEDSSHGLTFMYPAPVALLYAAFYTIPKHAVRYFLAFTGSGVLGLELVFFAAMRRRGVRHMTVIFFLSSMTVFSYPLWFEYLLGNMEIIIFLIVAGGMLAFLNERYYLAAVLFGLATSMKLFPLVYFGLFLPRKLLRQIFLGFGTIVASTIFSLWLINPALKMSWAGISSGLKQFQVRYMLPILNPETGFDHSLFAFIKRLVHSLLHVTMKLEHLTIYLAVTALIGLWIYARMIYKLPLINQIMSLTVASILLPPTSHDYTLLHLYLPTALLLLLSLDAARRGQTIQKLTFTLVCVAIACGPESEFIFRGFSFGGQIKCLVLIVLFVLVLRYPFSADLPGNHAQTLLSPQSA